MFKPYKQVLARYENSTKIVHQVKYFVSLLYFAIYSNNLWEGNQQNRRNTPEKIDKKWVNIIYIAYLHCKVSSILQLGGVLHPLIQALEYNKVNNTLFLSNETADMFELMIYALWEIYRPNKIRYSSVFYDVVYISNGGVNLL